MHQSAISNTYYMQRALSPKERTPMEVCVNGKRAVCHRCGPVRVMTIITPHMGTGKIELCSQCNSVLQVAVVPPRPKKKGVPVTVFVWKCVECGAEFHENHKLPKAIGPNGDTCRVCSNCFGEVKLTEKQS